MYVVFVCLFILYCILYAHTVFVCLCVCVGGVVNKGYSCGERVAEHPGTGERSQVLSILLGNMGCGLVHYWWLSDVVLCTHAHIHSGMRYWE